MEKELELPQEVGQKARENFDYTLMRKVTSAETWVPKTVENIHLSLMSSNPWMLCVGFNISCLQ